MYAERYAETDVLDRDPLELVCLLYAKALEKLNQARCNLEAGQIRPRADAIAHAMEIVLELQGSLNGEAGGEIASNLARLYDYVQERLIEANVEQQVAPLDDAIRVMETLYDGWKQIQPSGSLKAEVEAPTAVGAGAGTARDWTA